MVRNNLESLLSWCALDNFVLLNSPLYKFVNGIAFARKAHYQNLKTLRISRTEATVMRPQLFVQLHGICRAVPTYYALEMSKL